MIVFPVDGTNEKEFIALFDRTRQSGLEHGFLLSRGEHDPISLRRTTRVNPRFEIRVAGRATPTTAFTTPRHGNNTYIDYSKSPVYLR